MRQLPYLNGLRAFEATARCGSIAAAAVELGVAPAAVSRMVRLLEARIGFKLFERAANRLVPTRAGRSYGDGIGEIFDSLVALTQRTASLARRPVLTVGVGPTFAIRWLIPRLAGFQKIAPDIDVRLTTGGANVPFADDWSCGIRLGQGDWPGLASVALFPADLTPVCTPALARGLKSPADLRPGTLLRVGHSPGDWPLWAKQAGVPRLAAAGSQFDYYGQALQAAVDGIGIAMGVRPYIDDDLRAGRLVAPFAVGVAKQQSWHLVYRANRGHDDALRRFESWIREQAAAKPKPVRRRAG
jgi:LysR family glycine cleavage system transcriptional activator